MDNLVQALRIAIDSIEEADTPLELQPIAFEMILAHLLDSTKSTQSSIAQSTQGSCQTSSQYEHVSGLERLASKIGVTIERIKDCYSMSPDEDKIQLTLSTKQIPNKKSNGTQMIALLLAAANETVFSEPRETTYSEVREWANYYNCYDSGNFSRSLSRLDNKIKIVGKGQKSAFTLKQTGWEEIATIMQDIA